MKLKTRATKNKLKKKAMKGERSDYSLGNYLKWLKFKRGEEKMNDYYRIISEQSRLNEDDEHLNFTEAGFYVCSKCGTIVLNEVECNCSKENT